MLVKLKSVSNLRIRLHLRLDDRDMHRGCFVVVRGNRESILDLFKLFTGDRSLELWNAGRLRLSNYLRASRLSCLQILNTLLARACCGLSARFRDDDFRVAHGSTVNLCLLRLVVS